MKNNQFKIPENAQVHENFRTWKSGKNGSMPRLSLLY